MNFTDPTGLVAQSLAALGRSMGITSISAGSSFLSSLNLSFSSATILASSKASNRSAREQIISTVTLPKQQGGPNCPAAMTASRNVGKDIQQGIVTGGLSSLSKEKMAALRKKIGAPGRTVDPRTGHEVGRFIVDPKGNTMIEPVGGRTVPAGRGGVDTHTLFPNDSNYHRLNPFGHANNPNPHGHGHLQGTGPGMAGQGPSIDIHGNIVPLNSLFAHWSINR